MNLFPKPLSAYTTLADPPKPVAVIGYAERKIDDLDLLLCVDEFGRMRFMGLDEVALCDGAVADALARADQTITKALAANVVKGRMPVTPELSQDG